MDTLQLPKNREKITDEAGEERPEECVKGSQPTKQEQSSNSTTTTTSTSPPSASSSPSHEFSFTVSLNPSSTTPEKLKSPLSSFAIDLSPADDIFFHGHLLPLHILSHLSISPRSSTNSLDGFNLPSKDCKLNTNSSSSSSSTTTNSSHSSSGGTKGSKKLKSLSLLGIAKWQQESCDITKKDKSKIRLDVGHILRRCVRMVGSVFSSGRKENSQFLRQPHSFSGNSSWRGNCKQERKERRRSSAPASMRTSPSNSGLLVPPEILPSQAIDSTMEELQNAIQAAIVHCKNSNIAMKDENLKC
ncbi:hypothetical protein NE237_018159 [Protea cynaroides]|uniref:BRI1 kinase inhibitor 1 n=1 Tax=Protea cynaroides TaxID=273540 RepID=A0A9Q0QNN9_9MAGN|nr:hypothetical protein NE237_018159 [Protea cynaroides]